MVTGDTKSGGRRARAMASSSPPPASVRCRSARAVGRQRPARRRGDRPRHAGRPRHAIMLAREGLRVRIRSDTAALHGLVEVRWRRPACGCCATRPAGASPPPSTRCARQSGVGIVLDETALRRSPGGGGLLRVPRLDPLHIANEGKLIAICGAGEADATLVQRAARIPLRAPAGARWVRCVSMNVVSCR